jgi:hypothetical protein
MSSDNRSTSRRIVHGSKKGRSFSESEKVEREEEVVIPRNGCEEVITPVVGKVEFAAIEHGTYKAVFRVEVVAWFGEEEVEFAPEVRAERTKGSAHRNASSEER